MAVHNNMDLTIEEETELEMLLISQIMAWDNTTGQYKADIAERIRQKLINSAE